MIKLGWRMVMLLCIIIIFNTQALAWGPKDGHTAHSDISAYAVEKSVLTTDSDYLKNLGLMGGLDEARLNWDVNEDGAVGESERKTVMEWLKDIGAAREDGNTRELNHFYNPVLNVGFGIFLGAPDWAQASTAQAAWGSGPPKEEVPEMPWDWVFPDSTPITDWSWQATRGRFYFALTSMDDSARQASFAKTFRGLGQQIHLLQDMSVPAHTRIDLHLFRDGLEAWAKKHIGSLQALKDYVPAESIVMPTIALIDTINGLVPVARLFDTDTTTTISMGTTEVGLAEWSNANFFSDQTINLPGYTNNTEFPFPNPNNTDVQKYITQEKWPETVIAEDGIPDTVIPISKVTSNNIVEIMNFAKPGYLTEAANTSVYHLSFNLDDDCYKEYAENLLPRAVGYSAALINYFFRGSLEISPPDRCVYGITDGNAPDGGGGYAQYFSQLKAKVRNTTPNEDLGPGTLVAVARYKVRNDYDAMLSTGPSSSTQIATVYSYSVSDTITLDSAMLASLNTVATELTFTFSQTLIPAGVTDLHLNVIFKGTLGNEQDIAVAVGNVDFGDPRHHVFINSTDLVFLDGLFLPVDSLTSEQYLELQAAGLPTTQYTVKTEVSFCQQLQPGDQADVVYDSMAPAKYGRIITIAEQSTPGYSVNIVRTPTDIPYYTVPPTTVTDMPPPSDQQIYQFRGAHLHAGAAHFSYRPTPPVGDLDSQVPPMTPAVTPVTATSY